MDIIELLKAEQKAKKSGEPLKEQYGRIDINLGDAREDEEFLISGDLITVAGFDGTASTTYFKLNHRHSRKVYPSEIEKIKGTFGGFYLTNAAEAGKTLTLYIGRAIDITPVPHVAPGGGASSAKQDVQETTLNALEVLITDGNIDLAALEVLLGTIDADTGAIKTAAELIDNALDAAGDDHLRVLPPEMLTDLLVSTSSGTSDTIAAPGEGLHIEVLGYCVAIDTEATTTTSGTVRLEFATSSIYIFALPTISETQTKNQLLSISGLRIKGAANEALTLTNSTFAGGNQTVMITVYYRIV